MCRLALVVSLLVVATLACERSTPLPPDGDHPTETATCAAPVPVTQTPYPTYTPLASHTPYLTYMVSPEHIITVVVTKLIYVAVTVTPTPSETPTPNP